jgi:hypothetical protein
VHAVPVSGAVFGGAHDDEDYMQVHDWIRRAMTPSAA